MKKEAKELAVIKVLDDLKQKDQLMEKLADNSSPAEAV